MLGSRSIAGVTALCLGLVALPAGAQPRVMVWPGGPGAPVADAEAELRTAGVEVVPWSRAREALAEPRRERAQHDGRRLEAVERALAAAQEQFLQQELDAMLETLHGVETDAVAMSRPDRCDALWELQFRLGLGHGTRDAVGDRALAEARHGVALAIDPSRRPLAELYGPDVMAAFLRAVDERSRRVPRAVPVRVQPADARVEIDCHVITETTAALRTGLHTVRVSAPGYEAWAEVIELDADDAIEVALRPAPDPDDPARRWAATTDGDEVDDGSASAHAQVLALARSQGAAAVLVVAQDDAGARVRPWGREAIGTAVRRPELGDALMVALGLLADDGRLQVPPPVTTDPGRRPPDEEGRARRPVARTWWLWTIVGSVVATSVAVGLGVGLTRPEPAPGRLVIVAREHGG